MGNNPIQNLVFIPPNPPTYTESRPRTVHYITTMKSKKRIPLYYIPCNEKFTKVPKLVEEDEEEDKEIRTTILYSHGNATDIGQMNDFLVLLHENLPVNICHYEYIGYGLSPRDTQPSEEHTYESIEAALHFLKVEKGLTETEIIVWGTSLGSGPTIDLTCKGNEYCGVVLECPFTSCCRVVEMVKKNRILTNVLQNTVDMFVNINKIGKVKSPIMIIHGKHDTVVPFVHGKDLWEKVHPDYKYKCIWVNRADHHDIITTMGTREYVQEIRKYVEFCEKTQMDGGVKITQRRPKRKKKGWLTCSAGDMEDGDYPFSPECSPRNGSLSADLTRPSLLEDNNGDNLVDLEEKEGEEEEEEETQ